MLAISSYSQLWIRAVFTAFVAKRFTNIAWMIVIGFTGAMTTARTPGRVIWAFYCGPITKRVMLLTTCSYCHRFSAFHATNCLSASFESFLNFICNLPGKFNHSNTKLETFLDALGTGLWSSSSSETTSTSWCRGCRRSADVEGNWVAATCIPSVDVKECFNDCLPIAFLDGR